MSRGTYCWVIDAWESNRGAHAPSALSSWWNQHCSRSYLASAAWNTPYRTTVANGDCLRADTYPGGRRPSPRENGRKGSGFAGILWLTAPRTPMDTWFWGRRTEKRWASMTHSIILALAWKHVFRFSCLCCPLLMLLLVLFWAIV